MANVFDRLAGQTFMLGVIGPPNTRSGLALGSVYAYATSGAAIGWRFISPVTNTLTDVYFFVSAIAGTPGVTTIELRNNISGTINKPGTSLLGSWTQSPGTTANKWIHASLGSPITLTIGVEYWIVIGDAGWTAGNTATVLYSSAGGAVTMAQMTAPVYTTVDGFTTAGLNQGSYPSMVLKFGDGSIMGSPWTNALTYTNNTRERGIKIIALTEPLIISGAYWRIPTTNINGLKIYSGTTAPGGTTDLTVSLGAGAADVGLTYFAPFTMLKNTVYRIVLTYSGNSQSPFGFLNEDNSQADTLACGFGGGTLIGTIDNGSGGWTDSSDQFPSMGLIVKEQGTVISGPVSISPTLGSVGAA